MSFLKLLMTVLMKMHASGRIFEKFYLKAIRDTFFSNMWSVIRRQSNSIFLVRLISSRRAKLKLFGLQGDLQIPSLTGTFLVGLSP